MSSFPLIIDMSSSASIRASPSWTNCSNRSCSVTSVLTSKRGVRRQMSSPNLPGSSEFFSVYSMSSMCFRFLYCLTTSRLRSPLDSVLVCALCTCMQKFNIQIHFLFNTCTLHALHMHIEINTRTWSVNVHKCTGKSKTLPQNSRRNHTLVPHLAYLSQQTKQKEDYSSPVPRPYLIQGKVSGELWPNPRFSFYGIS